MTLENQNYARFYLVQEMMGTVDTIRKFDPACAAPVAEAARRKGHLLLTGELKEDKNGNLKVTEVNIRHMAYTGVMTRVGFDLIGDTMTIFEDGNADRFALTANENTPIEAACGQGFVLKCGWENAVAATKSVVEQVLFEEAIVRNLAGKPMDGMDALVVSSKEDFSQQVIKGVKPFAGEGSN